MNASELARELELSRHTVHDWLKERRNIPQKRLEQLSKLFNLSEEYFQKELLNSEKLKIQKAYLDQNATFLEYEKIIKDDEGNEHLVIIEYSPEEHESRNISGQIKIAELIEQVAYLLTEGNNYSIHKNIIGGAVDLIKHENNSEIKMLQEVIHYLTYKNRGFDTTMNKDLVKKLDEIYSIYEGGE